MHFLKQYKWLHVRTLTSRLLKKNESTSLGTETEAFFGMVSKGKIFLLIDILLNSFVNEKKITHLKVDLSPQLFSNLHICGIN